MNICVFDTETTGLEKPFCYNVGYRIIDTTNFQPVVEREYIVEQIWHNLPLFSTAYYAEKRPIYVNEMRKHTIIMDKFGYICRQMARDFRQYEVHMAFAYNSNFDEKVFNFNCDWFKCNNPFDTVEIKDIRGFAHHFIVSNEYKLFCEENSLFTESGNYSTTAEAMYRFIAKDTDFIEAHTALNDSTIETEILKYAVTHGANLEDNYSAKVSIERQQDKTLHIRTTEQTDYYFDYHKIRINKDKTDITLK